MTSRLPGHGGSLIIPNTMVAYVSMELITQLQSHVVISVLDFIIFLYSWGTSVMCQVSLSVLYSPSDNI